MILYVWGALVIGLKRYIIYAKFLVENPEEGGKKMTSEIHVKTLRAIKLDGFHHVHLKEN